MCPIVKEKRMLTLNYKILAMKIYQIQYMPTKIKIVMS